MKKAGEIFTEERKKQGLSWDEVIKKTKIPRSFLVAIESGDYSTLPRGLYPNLYVKKYARLFNLSPKRMVAVFRRDYLEFQGESKKLPLLKVGFQLSWQKILVVGLIGFIFFGYLLYQYLSFVYPPRIKMNLLETNSGVRILEGKTDPRATLRINNKLVPIDDNGDFSYQINQEDGDRLTVVVESPSGKARTILKEL